MTIETLDVQGFAPALHGMRDPMDSWKYNDTEGCNVGPNDTKLSKTLQEAGPEHCKHLRMIMAWADIKACRAWWTEADTYRAGVEKVSCSTMHKLMSRPLEMDDFEYSSESEMAISQAIRALNARINNYKALKEAGEEDKAKEVWRGVIELLPQSYLQKRTVMFSYAALRNIVRQRKGHKMKEWKQFIDWCHTLPNSWMIFE